MTGRFLLACLCLPWCSAPAGAQVAAPGAVPQSVGVPRSVAEMFAQDDPRREPLEIEMIKEWDEDGVHVEQLYFTGQEYDGVKTRVYAYRGAPSGAAAAVSAGEKLPGVLHCHGGGGSASLGWVKWWAQKGYVCVSFDFSGDTNKNAGPEFKREHFTRLGPVVEAMQTSYTAVAPERRDPRWNFWYHCTWFGRRALTLLEQHPAVDPERLGAFGISAGGYLCWHLAGADARLKTVVPIYGNAAGIYRDEQNRVIEHPDAAFELRQFQLHPEAPELFAPLIKSSVLYMTASNDGFDLDQSFDTLDRIPDQSRVRQLITPRFVHHMEPEEGRALPLWMERQLSANPTWPATPELAYETGGEMPRIKIKLDRAGEVNETRVFYALNNPHAKSRYWRDALNPRREGEWLIADAPFMHASERLDAFATIGYGTGERVSSRVVTLETSGSATLRPTLQEQALIDDMTDDDDWYWVPAYTDPMTYNHYFTPWQSPAGERGFTFDKETFSGEIHFDIATHKLGDPQFQGHGRKVLLLDYWGPSTLRKLKVRAVQGWYSAGQRDYFYDVTPEAGQPGWVTMRLDAALFKDKDGQPLPDWGAIQVLDLLGQTPADNSVIFHNLRWAE